MLFGLKTSVVNSLSRVPIIFIFFLVSKNVIYTKGYSMHEEHRANLENTRRANLENTRRAKQRNT